MMYDVWIENGRIVTEHEILTGGILIQDGRIAKILGNGERPQARQVIDAKENYIFPGAIDTHAHLNEPG